MDDWTVLPDGSAYGVIELSLPADHWIYTDWEFSSDDAVRPVEIENVSIPEDYHENVKAAVRYALRGATGCGRDMSFDPDAVILNVLYALREKEKDDG